MADLERINHSSAITQQTKQSQTYSAWIIEALKHMAKVLPNGPTEAQVYKMYTQHLGDLRQSRLKVAFGKCVKELKFFPTIGQIREFSESHVETIQDTFIDPKGPRCTLCEGSRWRYTDTGKVVRCECPKEAFKSPEIGEKSA